MKVSSKPISSPGRTDKFPPPLMRFQRSNAGSRSRGRSRSSPMFMRKKNSVAIETSQEPSSPKVTCIGQVRVRRSSKSAAAGIRRSKSRRKTRRSSKQQHPCWWVLRKVLFCRRISRKPKPISSFFRKWVLFCGFGCSKIGDNNNNIDFPPRVESDPNALTPEESGGSCNRRKSWLQQNSDNSASTSSSPPKYAFLLNRCRFAPYRSSSLACKFWGPPLNATEPEESATEPEVSATESANLAQEFEQEKPSSSPNSENAEPRKSQETGDSESSTKDEEEKQEETKNNVEQQIGKSAVHPLLLTRCKSEPARTGQRLRRFAEPHQITILPLILTDL